MTSAEISRAMTSDLRLRLRELLDAMSDDGYPEEGDDDIEECDEINRELDRRDRDNELFPHDETPSIDDPMQFEK